ncbi:MAG: site-specific integrase [Planctomycetes bacterium]|nr:site-specific integrase [Planctomycetota bacterium]
MSLNAKPKAWIDMSRTDYADPRTPSPVAEYLDGLGEGSKRTMRQSLSSIAALVVGQEEIDPHCFRWEKLTAVETGMIHMRLATEFKPATANKMLSALRGVLRVAHRMGLMDNNHFRGANADLRPIPPHAAEKPTTPPPPITPVQVKQLLDACAKVPGPSGRRDAALLVVFLCTGLRRAEAATLDLADYKPPAGTLLIRGETPEKVRTVTLRGPARAAMKDWVQARGAKPGPLFLPVGRGDIVRHRRMTDQAVYDIFNRITTRGRLRHITTRDVRRAYVVSLIHAGKTPDQVKALTGHASWINDDTCAQLARERAGEGYDIENLPYRPPAVRTPAHPKTPARKTPGTKPSRRKHTGS